MGKYTVFCKKKKKEFWQQKDSHVCQTAGLWMRLIFQSNNSLTHSHLLWTVFSTGDEVETFPVLEIDQSEMVDTNGAGDAFVGGTVWLSYKDVLSKYIFNNFNTLSNSSPKNKNCHLLTLMLLQAYMTFPFPAKLIMMIMISTVFVNTMEVSGVQNNIWTSLTSIDCMD